MLISAKAVGAHQKRLSFSHEYATFDLGYLARVSKKYAL